MKVSVEHRRLLFEDVFEIEEAVLRYQRFDGSMTGPVRRLNFERGDSAAAILFDRARQIVILVEQFRYPAWSRDSERGWLVEAIAGVVESGESPEAAVRREIEEEAGYRLETVTHVSTFFLSPGGSSERVFLYVAFVNDTHSVNQGGGATNEDEDTRVVEIPITEVRGRLGRGDFTDAKTMIGLQWLAAYLDGFEG